MAKSPEEGLIWEWRAFGQIPAPLRQKISSFPTRMGVDGHRGTDLYFISPASNQNVKVRNWNGEWLLKFKYLLEVQDRGIELYSESATQVFRFPVGYEVLEESARLLAVQLPDPPDRSDRFSLEEMIRHLGASSPEASTVETSKVRSQYEFEQGWVEIADISFPRARVQSLSLHSPVRSCVERMLSELHPGPELQVMNYVQACRQWK